MKVLINPRKRKQYFVKDASKDYHSSDGFVTVADMEKGGKIKTNKGVTLLCADASFRDLYGKIKRGPQVIPRKDIGLILTECGVNKTMTIVEAGSGSGAAGIFLAMHCKKLYSYDVREDHHKIAVHNFEAFGFKNVTAKVHDIYTGIPVKCDMLVLDLPEPWLVLEHAAEKVNSGGYIVSYSPTIPQVADFVNALGDEFYHIKTVEIIQREWDVSGRKVRPKTHQEIGHSGFMSFVRKI